MAEHRLKCWPEPFRAIWKGEKRHEIRVNDRSFTVGDTLLLEEWNPDTQKYVGASLRMVITHITKSGQWGLPPNLCVMSIGPIVR